MARTLPGEPAVVRVTVRVKPKARHTRIVRADGLTLEASLAAPPVDGAANDALLALLSRSLSLPKRSLRLVLGQSSKQKLVEVVGLEADEIATRLAKAFSSQR